MRGRRFPKSLRALVIACAVVLIISATVEIFIAKEPYILFGTKIGEVKVGGLSPAAALIRLEQGFKKQYANPVKTVANQKVYTYYLWELGLSPNYQKAIRAAYKQGRQGGLLRRWQERKNKPPLSLELSWEQQVFEHNLLPLANLYALPAKESKLVLVGNENEAAEVVYQEEVEGRFLNLPQTFNQLRQIGLQPWQSSDRQLNLVFTPILAFPQKSDFVAWDLKTKIAEFTTAYQPSSNRGQNIQVATKALDGTLLYPYQVLSLNQVLGERTAAKGYLPAPTIVEGKHEQQLGGGICQVASTLYNTVLQVNQARPVVKVIERHPHSLGVDYVPENQDAALAYGYKDFRFYQQGETPWLIRATAIDGKLTLSFYGLLPR